MKSVSSLHFFDNALCMVEYSYDLRIVSLFQYDLVSASINKLTIEKAKFSEDSKPVICSDKGNLFLITGNNKNKGSLYLSVFQRHSSTDSFKILKDKKFNALPGCLKGLNIFFSQCVDGNLYVFYSIDIKFPTFFTFDDVYLLTICVKTLRVIKNEKLSTKNIKVKRGTNIKDFFMMKFEKMFFH